jgi:dolichol kinase
MDQQTVYAILFLTVFLLLVVVSHLLYRYLNISSENSRKFLHVSGGVLALFAPLCFRSHWMVLILCGLAFMLLLFTYVKHWLPAVHHTKRKSVGSVVFPIPIYICFLVSQNMENNLLFYIPISFLTISDTIAEWSGKRWGNDSLHLMNNQKTLAGCICFALSALLIGVAWGIVFKLPSQQILFMSISSCMVATLAELVSTKGLDNLTVPLSTLLWMSAF